MTIQEINNEIKHRLGNHLISDGYHTFEELYDLIKGFNACLFNEWAVQKKYDVYKSMRHSDGELCFGGGWFIVGAELPSGYISKHYRMEDWDLFEVPTKELGKKWDGHTSRDVFKRLEKLCIDASIL